MKGGFIIKKAIILVLILILLIGFLSREKEEVLIPNEAIRFRVIANSNSFKDQNIKLKVRDNLQKKMTSVLKDSKTIEESRNLLKNNVLSFQENAYNTLKKINSNQNVDVKYGKNYFPEKVYKGVTYKEGEYESLVVTLGEGKGDNWWCVLFPPLCLLEAEKTQESKDVEYKFFVKELIDKYFNNN